MRRHDRGPTHARLRTASGQKIQSIGVQYQRFGRLQRSVQHGFRPRTAPEPRPHYEDRGALNERRQIGRTCDRLHHQRRARGHQRPRMRRPGRDGHEPSPRARGRHTG